MTQMKLNDKVSCTIRSVCANDAESLAELCVQLGYASTAEQLRGRLQRIETDANHAIFIAEIETGEIIGFIDLDMRCLAIKDAAVEVCGLVVDQNVRGRGCGRALLQKAEDWAVSMGARDITLRSNVVRKEAHAFYESCGYEIYKQQMAFQKSLARKTEPA